MSTPSPPSSPNPPTVTFSNGLLGGASGSLGGTNPLQQAIDTLTTAVTNLTTTLASANFNNSQSPQMGTRQQQSSLSTGFPSLNNPFQMNQQQSGIGGGGPGGTGNVSSPVPFGKSGFATLASAAVSFGASQMQPQLTLNQYATQAMMLSSSAPYSSRGQQMQSMYASVGATPQSLSYLGTGVADNIGAAMNLSQLAGVAPNMLNSNALGRAGMGATSAFHFTTGAGATTSSSLAAGLYAPTFSQNMMALGYNPIRSMTGGAPMNAGQSAQSIMQGLFGKSTITQSSLYGNLSSPRGQAVLSALDQGSGISNAQMQSYLSGYNQLFQKGLNVSQANSLFSTAAGGSGISQQAAKNAQASLNKYGVSTANNDVQNLLNNQATTTGRLGDYAGGFNSAITSSTTLLEGFNRALSDIMNGPLGTATGAVGGFGGVMAGAQGGIGFAGTMGAVSMIKGMLGSGAGSAAGAAGGSLFGAGGAGMLGAGAGGAGVGVTAAGAAATVGTALIAAGTVIAINKIGGKLAPKGSPAASASSLMVSAQHAAGNPTGDIAPGIPGSNGIAGWLMSHLAGFSGTATQATKGGGAAGIGGTRQNITSGGGMNSGVSGSAKGAVGAAESQLGVPYVYGAESPGVGFDCSALVQWAYKQAGVSLPRTANEQYNFLRKRSVPLGSVQEGDLVFTAGSDGTANAPGHVGMMINDRQLIQAPHTGQDVEIISYDPKGWTHAGRPSGSGSFITGQTGMGGSGGNGAFPGLAGNVGNKGLGGSGGSYGSVNEVDVISAMGGGLGGAGGITGSGNGTSGSSNKVNGGSTTGSVSTPMSAHKYEAIARQIASKYGWGSGTQWNDFLKVENREDGDWSMTARNASGAYGFAQFLAGPNEYYSYGGNPNTPQGQFKAMFNYIKGRYGSPSGAWASEQNRGWYGAGGNISIVGERGPEMMMQTPGGGAQVFSNAQTMAFINAIKGNAAQSPWKTDITSGGSTGSSAASVSINFNKGSIVISGGTGSSSDISKSGRELAATVLKELSSEAVHAAIRRGEKL